MKPITINDIAKLAGVSKSTVSRVLSNPSMVKKTTRDAVMKIVNENSFVPNHLAQGLAGVSTKTIGIIVDELYNSFFIEIVEGVDRILSNFDYSLQLYSSRWIEEKELHHVSSLISKQVDGILLAPINNEGETIDLLKHSNIPFVLVNCIPEDSSLNYVAFNNYRGGELVAEYINSLEKEQVVLITGYSHQTMDNRVEGFYSKVNYSDSVIRYNGIKTFEDGLEISNMLLARNHVGKKKTVLFITNDNVAIGVSHQLSHMGIKIPEQVAIIGFDDIKLASLCKIPLTTVSQSIKDIGKLAALDLLDLINGKAIDPPGHVLEPKLIVRESS
ncbi:MAG: LacI family DNA-binding transcriptional regulator [Sphaerochaetaceae bacterium]|nr:LacI family DNA-binding transcriptional regulator [Sphaerochaetaceae bacterium]